MKFSRENQTKPNSGVFFSPFEAFRGIAALVVVWFHSPFRNGTRPPFIEAGEIMVDFFFVLSGFVLAHAYLSRITDGLSFRKFIIMRLARLYPLHLFTLLILVPYVFLSWYNYQWNGIGDDPTIQNNAMSFIMNLTFTHALGFLDDNTWNYPSWSISAEIFTYMLFFLLAVLFGKAKIYVFALVSICSFILMMYSFDHRLVQCFASFFAGAAVYWLYLNFPFQVTKGLATSLEIILLTIVVVLVTYSPEYELARFLTYLSFVFLIYLFATSNGQISDFLSTSMFGFLGKISYSIYMVHAFIFINVKNIAVGIFGFRINEVGFFDYHASIYVNIALLAIVIFCANATYKYIEIPGKIWMSKLLSGRTKIAIPRANLQNNKL